MVGIDSIPDFPGMPGQRPQDGVPTDRVPLDVVLVAAPLDSSYENTPLDAAAVDAYIAAEIAAGRAFQPEVERWDPWSELSVELSYPTASQYNYARFTVGAAGGTFYAFLTTQYSTLHVSRYEVTPDYWTTFSWSLGYSTIERGHVAVAASQNDTYGDQYLTAPEPIEASPARGVIGADLLGSAPSAWTVLVISANDLRGGTGYPFFDKHFYSGSIANASNLAESATEQTDGSTTDVPDARYPWADTAGTGGGGGEPVNGYVPDAQLAYLDDGPKTLPPAASGPIQAEYNTAVAWSKLHADHPGTRLGGPAGGYWSHDLDVAIHNNPGHYGVIDTGLSPVGESPHGLGIRLNFSGVSETVANSYGFTRYNDYTWTYDGPFIWDDDGSGSAEGIGSVYVPKVESSQLSTIDDVPAGGGVYLFTMAGFAEYMTIMQGAPWVISGIAAVRLVPSWAVAGGNAVSFVSSLPTKDPSSTLWGQAAAIPVFAETVTSHTADSTVLAGWRDTLLGDLDAAGWRKLLTSQFTDILVSNGDSFTSFKPDQWHDSGIDFHVATGAAHGDPSIRIIPTGYNELGDQMGIETPFGGSPGMMRSGYGSAASQTASNDVTPHLQAYSSKVSWLSAKRNKELAVSLGLLNTNLSVGLQAINTIMSFAAAAPHGPLAELGAIGGGAQNLVSASLSASNTMQMIDASQDGAFDIVAQQLGLTSAAAVKTFDSWYQSLSSASGSGAEDSLASGWRAILAQAFKVIIAAPSVERVKTLVATWDRYGYMIGQAFNPGRLDAMTSRTYWKTSDTTIVGRIPQAAREAIIAAFERGTTVWTTVADIGHHTDNDPRTGQEY